MSHHEPDEPTPPTAGAAQGWVTSLLFWLCLVLAATMYGVVALAPKLLSWLTLKQEHYTHQVRLVELERKVKYLGRVVDAMENDADFAAQLARVNFDAARPGDERIAVDPMLSLDARDRPTAAPALPRTASLLVPLLRQVTDRPDLRRALLTIAAALILFAFTFLQEPAIDVMPPGISRSAPAPTDPETPVRPAPRTALFAILARRYRRPSESA